MRFHLHSHYIIPLHNPYGYNIENITKIMVLNDFNSKYDFGNYSSIKNTNFKVDYI